MRRLAPVGVSVYSRINHFKKTIDALKKNPLAGESELYIFSDAPCVGDEELVSKIREYIRTIDGFKNVHVIERSANGRVANNRGGMKQLLDQYGKVIFLEEDIITAPGFLTFMNEALDFYENDERVLSITGYCPPFKMPKNYKDDVFALQRFSAWGFATWREKFDPYGYELKQHGVYEFLRDKEQIRAFLRNGDDLLTKLMQELNNEVDALDIKLMYYVYKYNMLSVYPSKSLVQNIGHDGSGTHCGVSDRFYHDKLWGKLCDFEFVKDIQVDERIRKKNYRFRRGGIRGMVASLTKKLGIYPLLKKIKEILP